MTISRLFLRGITIVIVLAICPSTYSDSFALLTYNIKGLPPLALQGNGPQRIIEISSHLSRYDIVLLQEVFAYRELIQTSAAPATWFHGPTARFRWKQLPALIPFYLPCRLSQYCEIPSSSGLMAMVFQPSLMPRLLTAQPYATCHGVLKDSNDCLAEKGLLGIELTINEHKLHVYTTHLDAGRTSSDRVARQHQIHELAEVITKLSANNALLLAGDLNLRRDDREDMQLLSQLLTSTGLQDTNAFESPQCTFGCKGLDYVLYRSGGAARLTPGPTDVSEATEFVDEQDHALSDHPPLIVNFSVSHAPVDTL